MSDTITAGRVVLFHYTLTNDAGETVDSSAGRDPMPYLHGAQNIVPGLEEAMEGRKAGDSFNVTVSPDKGYGERQGPGPQAVPRSEFPPDMNPMPGMQLAAEMPNGQVIPLFITKVDEDSVWVDPNHPLAGENLHFAIEIVRMRDATESEMQHGHPHGPDGHAHHH